MDATTDTQDCRETGVVSLGAQALEEVTTSTLRGKAEHKEQPGGVTSLREEGKERGRFTMME